MNVLLLQWLPAWTQQILVLNIFGPLKKLYILISDTTYFSFGEAITHQSAILPSTRATDLLASLSKHPLILLLRIELQPVGQYISISPLVA